MKTALTRIGASIQVKSNKLGVAAVLVAALAMALGPGVMAQGTARGTRFTINQPAPGGVSPSPVITSISNTNGLRIEWFGLKAPYQLFQSPTVANPVWSSVGDAIPGLTTTVIPSGDMGFFNVKGPVAGYAGDATCLECHSTTHRKWSATRHAKAFDTLKTIGQHENKACLACHTVGYGHSGGFASESTTSHLKGVQCESCHGPAADHANNELDPSLRPVKSPSAMICGGCHNGAHHPTYDEWNTAGHSDVTPTTASYFLDAASGAARMNSCGACHSGAVRLSMLDAYRDNRPLSLPSAKDAASVAVACVVCHDGHGDTGNASQLRNPTYSTKFFSYSTATNTDFAKQYALATDVNICAQCHNQRGAVPLDSGGRPPHYSVQYNILIGQITATNQTLWGLQNNAQIHSKHTTLQAQCTECHTHPHNVNDPTEANPNYTGHSFEPHREACVRCHETPANAESLVVKTQSEIKGRIQAIKSKLDLWGSTKAPEALRATYGPLAWEYTSAGRISNPPPGRSGVAGPKSTEQSSIPNRIKEARFYLYMVEHEGSYGVHNAKYSRFLLDQAEANATTALNAP